MQEGGIEIYKGNMLIILADLYYALFPDAKWIFISRKSKQIVRSMKSADKGEAINKANFYNLVESWRKKWWHTKPSKNCLEINYEDFLTSPKRQVRLIAKYLDKFLTPEVERKCIDFFHPTRKK